MAVFLQATVVLLCAVVSVQAASPSWDVFGWFASSNATQAEIEIGLDGSPLGQPMAAQGCPAGWESKFGKCYLTILPKKSYADCLSTCTSLEATLPCVMNTVENAYLAGLYQNFNRNNDETAIYLGLNDHVTEGSFQWQEGCFSTLYNFSPREPNDAHGGEDCTAVYTNGLLTWNDLRCNTVSYCVCEKDEGALAGTAGPVAQVLPLTPQAAVHTVAPVVSACPAGWESKFGKCYLPLPEKKNHTDCLSHCTSLEATLPCVMNAAESLYLVGLYPKDLEFCAFMGLNDIVTEGVHKWQEGCASTFTYFIPGEPNNYHDEDCASVCLRGDKRWNDLPCSFETYCVCEKSEGTSASVAPPVAAPPVRVSDLLVTTTVPTPVVSCPSGWESRFGKCYLTTLPKQNYPDCLSTCTSLETTLPCVQNEEESLYIVNLYPNDLEACAFLGLNDIVTEGTFQWQEGCSSSFSYFLPGQPDQCGDEDCVSACWKGNTMWNDLPCSLDTFCVCEKSTDTNAAATAAPPITTLPPSEPEVYVPLIVPTPVVSCPAGWESKFGKCYLTTLPKQNYTECLSTCTALEATLPCVLNTEESLYLASLSPPNDMLFCAFLGLNDIVTEGKFEWQEGCASTFTYYLPGEPNNYNNWEDCVSVCFGGRTMWNDMPCNANTHCVCEKSADVAPPVVVVPPTPTPQHQCTCADCTAHHAAGQPQAAHACSFYCYNNC